MSEKGQRLIRAARKAAGNPAARAVPGLVELLRALADYVDERETIDEAADVLRQIEGAKNG